MSSRVSDSSPQSAREARRGQPGSSGVVQGVAQPRPAMPPLESCAETVRVPVKRARRVSQTDRLVARAISLAVQPPWSTSTAVELLARMAGGNPEVLERAMARIASSGSDDRRNVVEEAVFLLRLALAEVTEEFGST